MQYNTVVDLPLIALFIFIATFLLVVARVWLKGKHDATHEHLARLPLDGDELPSPNDQPPTPEDGGRDV